MDDITPAEEYQLKIIYAAVFSVLGYEKSDVAQLQKTILAEIRSIPFQSAIAGHSGSGSVKYGDRYPPLAKCISAFKSNIANLDMEIVRDLWLWMGRESHDYLLRRYTRQFASTVKICSCIGFAIKWQHQHNGRLLLERGEHYYLDKDPDYVRQLQIGKMMIIGVDKLSRPLALVRVRLHNIKEQDRETMRRLDVLIVETCKILASKLNGCTVIYDLTKYTSKNRDKALLKFGLQNFTKIYPGIFSQFLLHNASATYKNTFKIISSSFDATFRPNIKFTHSTDDLLEFVSLDQLPKELGGTSNIDAKGWIPPRKEDDTRMRDTETRDRLLAQRSKLLGKFNEKVCKWISGDKFSDRNEVSEEISSLFYELDPYVRSRTIWDRQGIVELCRPELRQNSADGYQSPGDQSPAHQSDDDEPNLLNIGFQHSLGKGQPILVDPSSALEESQPHLNSVFYGQDAILETLSAIDPEVAINSFEPCAPGDGEGIIPADLRKSAYHYQEPQPDHMAKLPHYNGPLQSQPLAPGTEEFIPNMAVQTMVPQTMEAPRAYAMHPREPRPSMVGYQIPIYTGYNYDTEGIPYGVQPNQIQHPLEKPHKPVPSSVPNSKYEYPLGVPGPVPGPGPHAPYEMYPTPDLGSTDANGLHNDVFYHASLEPHFDTIPQRHAMARSTHLSPETCTRRDTTAQNQAMATLKHL